MQIAIRLASLLLFTLPSLAEAFIFCPFLPLSEVTPGAPLPGERITLAVFDSYHVLTPTEAPRNVVVSRNGLAISVSATFDSSPPSNDGQPFNVDLGTLPEGRYTIEYESDGPPPAGSSGCPLHKATLEFSVSTTGVVTVVEYYNAALDHYFMTSAPEEIQRLDSGAIRGWARTGETFRAYASASMPSTATPVCRFYAPPSVGVDSHFFSDDPRECEAVKTRWPTVWIEESSNVFGTAISVGSRCSDGAGQPYQRVHRLYNNRPDANHRYVTSLSMRDEMLAKGWVEEGRYPDATNHVAYAMCVPK